MNIKKLLSLLVVFFALVGSVVAQQPYGGCWHPDGIKNWSPENDPDAKFNRSTVALQPRFQDPSIKANEFQFYDGQVAACLTMNPMCSQTPSQGANNFIGYNPTYWQYLDVLIWWGGSAGEGIIIPPSAPVTDIAHLNGVKVLGQIFFPPTAFSGNPAWVAEMLTQENGKYIYAEKLYQIAKYFGFDGWFINEETNCNYNQDWYNFFKYYFELADADGNSHHEIQWYDMSTSYSNKKNIFTDEPRFSYFSNYGSPSGAAGNKTTFAGWGIGAEQYFHQLYHGVECAQGGISGNGSYFQSCFPKTGHAGSIDLFNVEEGAWKQVVKDQLGTPDACGSVAYDKMKTVFSNEARFWTNLANDPSNTSARDGGTWPGLANAIMERTSIQTKPFVTSFSAGLGKHRFVNGEKKGTQDWYHRGMQDILPTWRWWIENNETDKLKFDFNWDDAYNVGTSLSVSGKLTANTDHLTRLYKTKISIASGDKLQLVYKTATANSMEVKLGIAENGNAFTTFPVSQTNTQNGWTVADIDLSSLAGKTVSIIALNFKSTTTVNSYSATLGQLAILPSGYAPTAAQVNNLTVQNELKEGTSDIRLLWDAPVSNDIHHYNVYFEKNGVKSLVGQTRNEAFYISKFERTSPEETSVKVAVTTVTKDMKEGAEKQLTVNYPAMSAPVVQLKAMKTLVKVGEEVEIIARATNFPKTYTWTTPDNATVVSKSENKVVYKFNAPGTYTIKVNVANAEGSTDQSVESYIEVSDSKELENVSVGKAIDSYSSAMEASGELPKWLIDGVQVPGSVGQKWCAGGDKSHWVIIDLKEIYKIYRFQWFDCGHKENASDNIKNYKIELSQDKNEWTEVLNETARTENTKEDYIKPTEARYVRFTPYDDEMPITIRVWEFEVYGIQGNLELGKPESQIMNINTTAPMEVAYSLGGDAKEDNFAITVTSSQPALLAIEDVAVESEVVQFNLKAKESAGKVDVTVKLTNGKWAKESVFSVKIQDPDNANILFNKVPVITTNSNEYDEDNNESATSGAIGAKGVTDANENTWWSAPYLSSGEAENNLVFDLGDSYKISSFRALFNYHGYLRYPESIEVYASVSTDDASAYQLVATLDANIKAENEFTPEQPIYAKFLKVRIMSLVYYGFSLTEFEAYGKKEEGENPEPPKKNYVPLTITTGFDKDVIAESRPSASSTSSALDDQGWVLYSSDVAEQGSVPANRELTSTKGVNYKLAPYAENNAVVASSTASTLGLSQAQSADAIYVLGMSANGDSNVEVTLVYDDETTGAPTTISMGDWWSTSSAGSAIYGLSRILRAATAGYQTDEIDNRYQFRMFEGRVPADPDKKIKEVQVRKANSGASYPAILAVSAETSETVGVENTEIESKGLVVYPALIRNGETLNIQVADAAMVQLISLQGSVLLQATDNVTQLPINGISAGTYLVVVRGENGIQTAKIVVR
ncbi:endo-beta-N-acetylglucosaminidase [Bacteroides sp.]